MTWVESLLVCDWWPVLRSMFVQVIPNKGTRQNWYSNRDYQDLRELWEGQLHNLCNGRENHNWVWSLRLILKWLPLSQRCGIVASLPEQEVHAPGMGDKTCNHSKAILEASSLRGNPTVSVFLHWMVWHTSLMSRISYEDGGCSLNGW